MGDMRVSMPDVRHFNPRRARFVGCARLQELDWAIVRRANKGHSAISGRAVDGRASLDQSFANLLDAFDLIGKMTKIRVLAGY